MSEPYPLLTVCPIRPQLARRRRSVGAASAPHRRRIGAPSRRARDDRARDDDGDRARDDDGDDASTTTARRIESRAPSSSNEASIDRPGHRSNDDVRGVRAPGEDARTRDARSNRRARGRGGARDDARGRDGGGDDERGTTRDGGRRTADARGRVAARGGNVADQ
jgi:hypothetical protein